MVVCNRTIISDKSLHVALEILLGGGFTNKEQTFTGWEFWMFMSAICFGQRPQIPEYAPKTYAYESFNASEFSKIYAI